MAAKQRPIKAPMERMAIQACCPNGRYARPMRKRARPSSTLVVATLHHRADRDDALARTVATEDARWSVTLRWVRRRAVAPRCQARTWRKPGGGSVGLDLGRMRLHRIPVGSRRFPRCRIGEPTAQRSRGRGEDSGLHTDERFLAQLPGSRLLPKVRLRRVREDRVLPTRARRGSPGEEPASRLST